MTTFKTFITEAFSNWMRYSSQSLSDDFIEYKKKEKSKWESRARQIGAKFPLFDTEEEFKHALDAAKIVKISSLDTVENMTANSSIEDIKRMVSSYHKPRNVDRIVDGFTDKTKMPLPIILKGTKGLWIMAGNTRQSIARVMGIEPKALLIDVQDKK